jgi:hypothetical protein
MHSLVSRRPGGRRYIATRIARFTISGKRVLGS